MQKYTLTEFSIFYKRLMIIELYIKDMLVNKYTEFYGENAYSIVYRYIRTIQEKRNKKDLTFTKIHKSDKTNFEKLELAISKMYISELLNLFSNAVFLKNKKIYKNFFIKEVMTNSTEFQKNAKNLKDFRNCIAHYNQKKYVIEKRKFIKSLLYFEKILACTLLVNYDILDKVNIAQKLSVKDILILIYHIDSAYFKDDKLLILMFDDIALINGYSFSNLPQRWTIIRQKFELEKKLKEGHTLPLPILQGHEQMALKF